MWRSTGMRWVNYQITLISAPAPLHATVQLGVALHYDWWLNRPPILWYLLYSSPPIFYATPS